MTTNKQEVKRYDCTSGRSMYCYGCYTMEEDESGDYVEWEAYEALQAECERLRCDARRYRWIRDGGWLLIGEDRGNGPEWPSAETVDALVDRAIAKAIDVTPST